MVKSFACPLICQNPFLATPIIRCKCFSLLCFVTIKLTGHPEPTQGGTLLLNGKTPQQLGVPNWRTQVTYVPQSRTQQKGTPSELYFAAQVCLAADALLLWQPDLAITVITKF